MSKRWAHVVDSNASSLSVWVAVRLPVTFCFECYGLWLLYYYCCLVHCIEMQCTWCWSNGSYSAGQQHAIVIWQQNWRKPRVFWIIFFFFSFCVQSPGYTWINEYRMNKKKTAVTWLWMEYLSGNAMNGCFLTICSDHIRLRELTNCFDSDLWMICSGNCTSYIGLSCDMYAFINCNSLEINCWQ